MLPVHERILEYLGFSTLRSVQCETPGWPMLQI